LVSRGKPPEPFAERPQGGEAIEASLRRSLETITFGAVAITARALQTAGAELTLPQWRVLVIVGGSPRGASVSDVAARLGSELSPASRLIGRMERRGLVETGKTDPDRRVTRVRLTDRGRTIRRDVFERRRRLLVEVLAGVGIVDVAGAELLARIGEAFRPFV
jgi:DNA-binding MarR family transcriptional regulator